MHWLWHRHGRDWLWECGRLYIHWNAPPLPSLFVGWKRCWIFSIAVDGDDGWWGSMTLCQDRNEWEHDL